MNSSKYFSIDDHYVSARYARSELSNQLVIPPKPPSESVRNYTLYYCGKQKKNLPKAKSIAPYNAISPRINMVCMPSIHVTPINSRS